jgi:hypothetical protein
MDEVAVAVLRKEIRELVVQTIEELSARDSMTIGTPSRGGELKIYFNAVNLEDAKQRITNAKAALAFAQFVEANK